MYVFFLRLAYNMYYPSTPFTFQLILRAYNYGLFLIICQNHVFHFFEIDQFGGAKIKRNPTTLQTILLSPVSEFSVLYA